MSRLIEATELNGYKFGLISPYAQKLFHSIIKSAPTVKAIPLAKVKQAREEIDNLIYVESYIDPYSVIEDVLKILDKLIESEE